MNFDNIKTKFIELKEKLAEVKQVWQDYKMAEKVYKKFQPDQLNDMEFLPAALELQETPPSPTGRYIMYLLCLFVIIAVLWASFGKVDIVAVANGKIIPSGHVKVIQPLESGVIKTIHVQTGQQVKKGDLLVEMDITQTGAERAKLQSELTLITGEIARLNAVLNNEEYQENTTLPANVVELQKRIMTSQLAEQNSKELSLKSTVEQREAEKRSIESNVSKLESTIPLITKRFKMTKKMAKDGVSSQFEALQIEEDVINQTKELEIQKERLKEVEAATNNAKEQLESTKAEFRKNILSELAEKSQQQVAIRNELAKAENLFALQKLTSPTDGTVQELQIHTIGGVVTPAQELMKIVPRQASLEAEVMILNKDIGFVNDSQTAEIKLEAFPFTKYGVIDGKVLHVSHDAIKDEELGLVYAARISMAKNVMQVEGKTINLSSGMSVTVEIKTGYRRIIEYFLSPILKYQAEVIRER